MNMAGERSSSDRRICPSATLSATNPTRTTLGRRARAAQSVLRLGYEIGDRGLIPGGGLGIFLSAIASRPDPE
jgi:hypothetical protein